MTYSPEEWEVHKDQILDLYLNQDWPIKRIIRYMRETYNFVPQFVISSLSIFQFTNNFRRRSYFHQFSKWNIKKNGIYLHDPRLLHIVENLWHWNSSPSKILEALVDHEGFHDLTKWQLTYLRKKRGWLYRRHTEPSLEDKKRIRDEVSKLISSGQGRQWGISFMQSHIRRTCNLFVSTLR